jgi:hypothetical protein
MAEMSTEGALTNFEQMATLCSTRPTSSRLRPRCSRRRAVRAEKLRDLMVGTDCRTLTAPPTAHLQILDGNGRMIWQYSSQVVGW